MGAALVSPLTLSSTTQARAGRQASCRGLVFFSRAGLLLRPVLARVVAWAIALVAALLAAPIALAQPSAASSPETRPVLTPQEREWIASQPPVRVSVAPGLQPYFEHEAQATRPHGFAIEMLGLLAERTGLRFEYRRAGSLVESIEAVKRGDADLMPMLSQPVAEAHGLARAQALVPAQLVLVVRRDIPDISPTSNFGDYRVAVAVGSAGELLMRTRFPAARVVPHADAGEALRAVASGDADLFVGYRHVAVYQIERQLLANLQVRGRLGPGLSNLGPAIRREAAMLQRVIDKGLATITQRERARLAHSWLPPGTLDDEAARTVTLTEGERAWLDARGRVRVGYDAAFAPVTFQTDLTQMRGLGADFMRLAAERVGLTLVGETGDSFARIYQLGLKREIDVIVGAVRTRERRGDYDFVGPFLRVATGIVTRSGDGLLVTKLDEVGRSRLALLDEHFLIPQLRVRYPMLELRTYPTQSAVLDAVARGEAEIGIGNLKVVNQLINDRYTGRVRVTGTVPDADSELYFAVRKDLPELSVLLRKGLDAISEAEAAEIERRWLTIEVNPGFTRDEALQAAAVVAVLMAMLLTYLYLLRRGNQRLRQARQIERDARRLAEEATASRGHFVSYLTHELRGTIGAIASGAGMLKDGAMAPGRREALVQAIQTSAQGFVALLESALQYEQQLERPVVLQPEPVDLAALWPQILAPLQLSAQAKGLSFSDAIELAPGVPTCVKVDAQRLRQVLNNLVGNAVKFTPQGRVEVRARLHEFEGLLQLDIEVRDSGPGLSADDETRLFQPYEQGTQGRSNRQGAGLGLAITRQIVLAMGGQITACNAAEGGACFSVRLPMSAAM
jgi:signal transduction histidine kinase